MVDENYNPTALQHSLKKGSLYSSIGKHTASIKWAGMWQKRSKAAFGRKYFDAKEREIASDPHLQQIWKERLKFRHDSVSNKKDAPWLHGTMTTRKVAKAVFWDCNPMVRSVTTTVAMVKMLAKVMAHGGGGEGGGEGQGGGRQAHGRQDEEVAERCGGPG